MISAPAAERRRHARLAVWLLVAGAACQRSGPAATGAERVVCVSRQINEYLYDIGAQDVLVARDLGSIYPPAITSLPSVGYHRALNADGIIAVKPMLFLDDGDFGPEVVQELVKKAGIPVLTLRPGGTVDSAEAMLVRLGALFHRDAQADSVVAVWQSRMDSVLADTAQWAGKPRPRVLIIDFSESTNDSLVTGRGGPADAMLHWAGADNAIDSVGGMVRLTPGLIARAAPDVILATDAGFDRHGSAETLKTLPGVARTPAGQHNRIYRITEQEIMYFGPRTPVEVRKLTRMVHE